MVESMSPGVGFSVVIPAYNAAAFIAKALESALSQTLQPVEVIVVNDGSGDNTLQVVEQFGDKVRCISHEMNKGLPSARNTGINNAIGEWIALLDADDFWHVQKLERQAEVILENPGADFVYTGSYNFFGDHIESLSTAPPASRVKEELQRGRCPFAVSSVVFRRTKAGEIGGFDPAMKLSEEWDMWLRFAKAGAEFAAVSEPLAYYRRSPAGLSHKAALYLEYQKLAVKKHIATELPAFQRWWTHRRLISRFEGEAAIVMRQAGSREHLRYMYRSILHYPLPLSTSDQRYKVALHMLLTSLGVLPNGRDAGGQVPPMGK